METVNIMHIPLDQSYNVQTWQTHLRTGISVGQLHTKKRNNEVTPPECLQITI